MHVVCLKQKTAQCATRAGAVSLCLAFKASGNLGQEKQQNKGMGETPGSSKWVKTAPIQFVVIETCNSVICQRTNPIEEAAAWPLLFFIGCYLGVAFVT